jgi:hypothetical protein
VGLTVAGANPVCELGLIEPTLASRQPTSGAHGDRAARVLFRISSIYLEMGVEPAEQAPKAERTGRQSVARSDIEVGLHNHDSTRYR